MKITDFLKKYSLIDNFYIFYDNDKNEYKFYILKDLYIAIININNGIDY